MCSKSAITSSTLSAIGEGEGCERCHGASEGSRRHSESGLFLAVGHVGLELRREAADDHYSMVLRTGEQTWTGGEGGE